MEAAWHGAAMARAKRMPPLKDLLSKRGAKPQARRTSWQAMYAMAAAWAAGEGEIRSEGGGA